MTRAEILEQYEVDENGVIRSPGKFEGEMIYVPAYWDYYMNGCADDDDGTYLTFYLNATDYAEWPELANAARLVLSESDQGFVSAFLAASNLSTRDIDKTHTPVPWAYSHGVVVTANADGSIPLNSRVVAKLEECGSANAEFIVRACNAHDDMLAALEECADLLEAFWEAAGSPAHAAEPALADARAVIAKARGE